MKVLNSNNLGWRTGQVAITYLLQKHRNIGDKTLDMMLPLAGRINLDNKEWAEARVRTSKEAGSSPYVVCVDARLPAPPRMPVAAERSQCGQGGGVDQAGDGNKQAGDAWRRAGRPLTGCLVHSGGVPGRQRRSRELAVMIQGGGGQGGVEQCVRGGVGLQGR